jgi:hypothetical protein
MAYPPYSARSRILGMDPELMVADAKHKTYGGTTTGTAINRNSNSGTGCYCELAIRLWTGCKEAVLAIDAHNTPPKVLPHELNRLCDPEPDLLEGAQ